MISKNQLKEERRRLIEEWALAPIWYLSEGVALALDLDPEKLGDWPYQRDRKEALDLRKRLEDFATRGARAGTLAHELQPAAFIAWSETVGFPFHPDWRAAVKPIDPPIEEPWLPLHMRGMAGTKRSRLGEEPSIIERESMLKLIIGMAKSKYGYDPNARRGTAVKAIENDLNLSGVPLSDDTIRKYLREADELVDREPPEADPRRLGLIG